MSKPLATLALFITALLPVAAGAADTASAPATAAQQLAASGPLTPVKFRNSWNGVVSQIAAMGSADQAQKLGETLMLGEMTPEAGGKDSAWLARCGDGDRVTLTAATPDSPLTHVTIETPINAAQLGPGRVAPAVMWTISFFHPERNSDDIKKLAVQLMRGMATEQTSTVQDGNDEYRLSALPDGALRFDANRVVTSR
ncbi:hypothetical protein [Silvimonas iriomotensis]|uniref:Uncharacterized protein n=1 Tax=Silvimonas iriomotensis TaxID=449662 RepID=A0ABQ2PCM5_9NEIS|nr:hypothetical protein [Silvimonas iriomotensis]GGP23255.1 hypothetical protein GCM10010970_32550 [Silvimonas iriomotensis]